MTTNEKRLRSLYLILGLVLLGVMVFADLFVKTKICDAMGCVIYDVSTNAWDVLWHPALFLAPFAAAFLGVRAFWGATRSSFWTITLTFGIWIVGCTIGARGMETAYGDMSFVTVASVLRSIFALGVTGGVAVLLLAWAKSYATPASAR